MKVAQRFVRTLIARRRLFFGTGSTDVDLEKIYMCNFISCGDRAYNTAATKL